MPATEAGLIKSFVKMLREAGAYVNKNHGGPHSQGRPDLEGCYKSLYFVIEAKQPGKGKNVTERQRAHLNAVREAGGIAIVATKREHIHKLLKVLDRRARGG